MGRPKKKVPNQVPNDKLEKLQTLLSGIDIDTLTTAIELLKRKEEENNDEDVVESDSPIRRRKKRVVSKHTLKNRFDDMKFQGKEKKILDEAASEDKKLMKGWAPTPRVRASDLVEVKCRRCGKPERVSPSVLLDSSRYLCNNCIVNRE